VLIFGENYVKLDGQQENVVCIPETCSRQGRYVVCFNANML